MCSFIYKKSVQLGQINIVLHFIFVCLLYMFFIVLLSFSTVLLIIIKNCTHKLSGTTEKIFEEKTGLLDIYVDNQNIRIPGSIRHLLTITTQDRKRLAQLQCIARNARNSVQEFINYFSQSNNKIFSTLYMISQSDDNVLKRHHIETMGLHPQHDRGFVSELALTHGFDITTSKNSWKCCPCDY